MRFILVAVSLWAFLSLSACSSLAEESEDNPNQVEATDIIAEDSWTSSDGLSHRIVEHELDRRAQDIDSGSEGVTVRHFFIDDVPIYEERSDSASIGNLVIFIHGQESNKSEYLEEMCAYAAEGYVCVSFDLVGSGEWIIDEPLMSLQVITKSSEAIDTVIEYYLQSGYAGDKFALIGISQGGSVAYHYAAYGSRTPSALVVGSATPDFTTLDDMTCIQSGERIEPVWSEDEYARYASENNPINNISAFYTLPILSGNGLDDTEVSPQGSQDLEKSITAAGNSEAQFNYYTGTGHEITRSFLQKMRPYVDKHMGPNPSQD